MNFAQSLDELNVKLQHAEYVLAASLLALDEGAFPEHEQYEPMTRQVGNSLHFFARIFRELCATPTGHLLKEQWYRDGIARYAVLDILQLLQIIGICSFHGNLFYMHAPPAVAGVSASVQNRLIQIFCEYTFNVHGLPPRCASAWFDTFFDTLAKGRAEFATVSCLHVETELKRLLPGERTETLRSNWPGFAIMVKVAAMQYNIDEVESYRKDYTKRHLSK